MKLETSWHVLLSFFVVIVAASSLFWRWLACSCRQKEGKADAARVRSTASTIGPTAGTHCSISLLDGTRSVKAALLPRAVQGLEHIRKCTLQQRSHLTPSDRRKSSDCVRRYPGCFQAGTWILIPLESLDGCWDETAVHWLRKMSGTHSDETAEKIVTSSHFGQGTSGNSVISEAKARAIEKHEELIKLQNELQKRNELLMQELALLRAEHKTFHSIRRNLHNQIQDLKGNVRVFVRVRPHLKRSTKMEGSHVPLAVHSTSQGAHHLKLTIPFAGAGKRTNVMGRDRIHNFHFDHVFQGTNQEIVFDEMCELVQSAVDGYHVCIFAYGQTGSGKTYTMQGDDGPDTDKLGIIPRAVRHIIHATQALKFEGWRFELDGSFLEVYKEEVRDLLAGTSVTQKLEVKHVDGATHVPGARVVNVEGVHHFMEMLDKATKHRMQASTKQNHNSSRSHSVFQLRIRGCRGDDHVQGMLNLVDLAGSERVKKSGCTGDRLKEAGAINASLHTLALVLSSLANKDKHVPFRNSKLTHLLQGSLAGRSSKVLMIANIASEPDHLAESLCTLKFADIVKKARLRVPVPSAAVQLDKSLKTANTARIHD